MRKQSLLKNPFRQSLTYGMVASLSMAALLGFSTSVSADGPNEECPTGTTLVAKFEWTSGGYVFEKPAGNGNVVILNGDAEGGSWTSNIAISHVILKGGTDSHIYTDGSGDFSKEVLDPKKAGNPRPDISNIQFCASETSNTDTGTSDTSDSNIGGSATGGSDTSDSDTGGSDTGGSDTDNSDNLSVVNTAGGSNADDVCDAIYGVHDEGLNDSQFVTINAPTYGVNVLGTGGSGFHPGFDLEGLDMNAQGALYASSGDDAEDPLNNAGVLYKINTNTGAIDERLGQICFQVEETQICGTEISGISFRPSDGSLWAWSEECGLIEVNIDSVANSTLVLPNDDLRACLSKNTAIWRNYSSYIEDMTWDNTSEVIYYSLHGKVHSYRLDNGENRMVSQIGGNIETLEMFPENNELLIIIVDGSQHVRALNLSTGEVIFAEESVGDFNDIEAISACIPSPTIDEPQSSDSVQITLADDRGSTYEITLVSHDAATKRWTYHVQKLDAPEGQKDYKDMSHFSLGIGRSCGVDGSTGGSDFGKDGSSNNFWGIKWNVEGGTFSFTLDGDYEVGTIPVLAKSSTYYNTDEIKGPVCPGEAGGFPE